MNNHKQKGFTIIELMIAMAFISFLLLFIMFAIVQVMRVYSKGLAIRQLNQAGRQFTEEFTRTARYGSKVEFAPTLNRICVGGVTYAWNTGDPQTAGSNLNRYAAGGPTNGSDISMIRVEDNLCATPGTINRAIARDLLPADLNVQYVDVDTEREGGAVAAVNIVFSTGGINAPIADTTVTPTVYRCPSGNEGAYCAFAKFDTTVYVRNR